MNKGMSMKKTVVTIVLIAAMVLLTTGCTKGDTAGIIAIIDSWLEEYETNMDESEEAEDSEPVEGVSLRLTYPVGYSPNVFTTGWVFGAGCTFENEDYSDSVRWTGSGSFSPEQGKLSRPAFSSTGTNTITLSVTIKGQEYRQTFNVNAVSPAGYAHIGMNARCDSYSLGCTACPHTTLGPITTGSSQVFINGKPAARVGDKGVAVGGCGPSDFEIVSGNGQVLIDGRPAAMIGSETRHAGGIGKIIGGG